MPGVTSGTKPYRTQCLEPETLSRYHPVINWNTASSWHYDVSNMSFSSPATDRPISLPDHPRLYLFSRASEFLFFFSSIRRKLTRYISIIDRDVLGKGSRYVYIYMVIFIIEGGKEGVINRWKLRVWYIIGGTNVIPYLSERANWGRRRM